MKRLEGKSAVVTGAASGIGRASSILFAQHGASVVCVDRSSDVEATAAAIRNAGGRAIALIKDASDEHDVAGMMQTAVKQHGGLDVCYSNAGIGGGVPVYDELTADDWIVFDSKKFQIQSVEDYEFDAAWIVTARCLKGEVPERIVALHITSLLTVGDTADGS